MPAIAAAAFASIKAEIELTPAISVTDAIIVMSALHTAMCRPTPWSRASTLGHPRATSAWHWLRSRCPRIHLPPGCRRTGPPRGASHEHGGSLRHGGDCLASVCRRGKLIGVGSDGCCHLLPGHVRSDTCGLVDPYVDDQHLDIVGRQPVSQVRILDALGVEGAQKKHDWVSQAQVLPLEGIDPPGRANGEG